MWQAIGNALRGTRFLDDRDRDATVISSLVGSRISGEISFPQPFPQHHLAAL